jgi:hypothetical protein
MPLSIEVPVARQESELGVIDFDSCYDFNI